MPELVVGYTEQSGRKLKKGNGFLRPNFGVGPKLNKWGDRYDEYDGLICCFYVVVGRAFIEIQEKFTGRVYEGILSKRGLYPGVETSDQPDEPDVVDASGGVEGVEGIGLASGSSSVTGCFGVYIRIGLTV